MEVLQLCFKHGSVSKCGGESGYFYSLLFPREQEAGRPFELITLIPLQTLLFHFSPCSLCTSYGHTTGLEYGWCWVWGGSPKRKEGLEL